MYLLSTRFRLISANANAHANYQPQDLSSAATVLHASVCMSLSVFLAGWLVVYPIVCLSGASLHHVSKELKDRIPCIVLSATMQQRALACSKELHLDTQALANLAWSMAHLNYKHEAVLDAIVNRLLSDMDSMNQRDLADLLSALAMLKHQPVGEAMDAIVQHTSDLLLEPGGMPIKQESCAERVSLNLKLNLD